MPFLLALSWGGRDYAWASAVIFGLILTSLCFGLAFLWVETHASHPILPLKLFRNSIFSISVVAAALIATGMFGATLFVPLFVQSVLGTTATQSGKILMPMTLSLLFSAMLSGQGVTRLGRYKPFAILGASFSALGVLLLSTMDASTSYLTVVHYVIVLGIGLGASMPVFSISVQNAVESRFIGTATSTLQFMRSIGGSIGVAIFGSVLANQFVPAFHSALPPQIYRSLSSEQLSRLDNPQSYARPEFRQQIEGMVLGADQKPQEVLVSIQHSAQIGLAHSITFGFLIGAVLLVFATILVFFLKEIPLRQSNRPATVSE